MIPVPRIWPESTIAILAPGPSLTRADCDYARAKADRVIAVNGAYMFAPAADVVYGTDGGKFWKWYPSAIAHRAALKYCLTPCADPRVTELRYTGDSGLEDDRGGLRSGQNSAYAAVNLAVHLGARRIVLVGVDLSRGVGGAKHCHPDHPTSSRVDQEPNYILALGFFPTLVAPLRALGISVVNCSRHTTLRCFPRGALTETLQ